MSFLEHGEGTSPQMGGWYLPHFFLIQNIKFGRSTYGAYTGGIYKGVDSGKSAYQMEL